MSHEFQLDNQLAIVTGASRGIGRGIARGLLQAGARVILVSRDEKSLAKRGKNCSTNSA